MRRLRESDASSVHRRHIRFHGSRCKGVSALHDTLYEEANLVYIELRDAERSHEDAKDAVAAAMAVRDRAEVVLEDAIRDMDAEAARCDRKNPALAAQKAIFPEGFGVLLSPKGEEQLGVLPSLKVRYAPFLSEGNMAAVASQLEAAEAGLVAALKVVTAKKEAEDIAFAEEKQGRAKVRAQIDSAYGRLRDYYKGHVAEAEAFFLRETEKKKGKAGTEAGTK